MLGLSLCTDLQIAVQSEPFVNQYIVTIQAPMVTIGYMQMQCLLENYDLTSRSFQEMEYLEYCYSSTSTTYIGSEVYKLISLPM